MKHGSAVVLGILVAYLGPALACCTEMEDQYSLNTMKWLIRKIFYWGGGFLWMGLPTKTLFLSKKKTLSCNQLILDCICPSKELSLWNKIKYLNLNILRTRCCKPLILQIQIIWSNIIHSLKYLRSATFGSKDIGIRKSEFVAKAQFL